MEKMSPRQVLRPQSTMAERPTKPECNSAIVLTVVKKHIQPIRFGDGTVTIGERIDNMLQDCARSGEQVQSVTLDICDEDWKRIEVASGHHGDLYSETAPAIIA